MTKPGEHKTVQARILAYAQAIGWTFVPRKEAEQRRGFDTQVPPAERAKNRALFFDQALWDYVIVHELLHFFVPNHGKLWKSLMRAHLGNYESSETLLKNLRPGTN
jgi:hypothetical protein